MSSLPPINGTLINSVSGTRKAVTCDADTTLGCFCRANSVDQSNVTLRQPGNPDTTDSDQELYEGFTVIVTPAKASGSIA